MGSLAAAGIRSTCSAPATRVEHDVDSLASRGHERAAVPTPGARAIVTVAKRSRRLGGWRDRGVVPTALDLSAAA